MLTAFLVEGKTPAGSSLLTLSHTYNNTPSTRQHQVDKKRARPYQNPVEAAQPTPLVMRPNGLAPTSALSSAIHQDALKDGEPATEPLRTTDDPDLGALVAVGSSSSPSSLAGTLCVTPDELDVLQPGATVALMRNCATPLPYPCQIKQHHRSSSYQVKRLQRACA